MRFVIIIFLFVNNFLLLAQNRDSLKIVAETNTDVVKKINALNQLSQIYLSDSVDMALTYGKQALDLARKNGDKMLEAVAIDNVSLALYMKQDYTQSIELLTQSTYIYIILHERDQVAVNLNRIGVIYHLMGVYDKALEKLSGSF